MTELENIQDLELKMIQLNIIDKLVRIYERMDSLHYDESCQIKSMINDVFPVEKSDSLDAGKNLQTPSERCSLYGIKLTPTSKRSLYDKYWTVYGKSPNKRFLNILENVYPVDFYMNHGDFILRQNDRSDDKELGYPAPDNKELGYPAPDNKEDGVVRVHR